MNRLAKALTHNRDRRYKHLLDVMPIYVIPIFLLLFAIVVAGGVVIAVLVGPPVYAKVHTEIMNPKVVGPFLLGHRNISYSPEVGFNNLNQEITVTLTLRNAMYSSIVGDSSMGLTKSDLLVTARLEGKEPKSSNFSSIHKISSQSKVMRCPQRQAYCDPIVVVYLTYVPYSQFRVHISLDNMGDLYENGMMMDYAKIEFGYVTDKFSRFEVGWRYTLLFIMIPFAVFFVLYTFVRQPLKWWTTEQKWTAILLLIIILYNNPIVGFQYVVDTWVIAFLNTVFVATFICYLLFTVIVTTHAAIKPVGERGIFFYLPKLVLIGTIWLFVIVSITYIRVKEKSDPSYSLTVANSFSAYEVLAIIVGIGIVLYILNILYYLLRGIGYFTKIGGIPLQFRSRIIVVWLLTLTIVIGTIVDVFLYVFRETWNNSAQFLSYFVLYNMYAFILGIFYLPSFTEKRMGQDEDDQAFIAEDEELNQME